MSQIRKSNGKPLSVLFVNDKTLKSTNRPDDMPRKNLIRTVPDADGIARLTKREREIIALVGEGLNNKEIAERLFISRATVRHHLSSIFAKLSVADRLKLIVYAYRHGLADLPD